MRKKFKGCSKVEREKFKGVPKQTGKNLEVIPNFTDRNKFRQFHSRESKIKSGSKLD